MKEILCLLTLFMAGCGGPEVKHDDRKDPIDWDRELDEASEETVLPPTSDMDPVPKKKPVDPVKAQTERSEALKRALERNKKKDAEKKAKQKAKKKKKPAKRPAKSAHPS